MSKLVNVAILGATGAVGAELLQLLEERNFPINELKLLASPRSAGKTLTFKGESITVEAVTKEAFEGVDILLASAGGSTSKQWAAIAVEAGAVVIDNSSAFRMDPEVPLVIPEINPEAAKQHKGIIANPNCTTIILGVAIYPLHRVQPIKRIVVSTYQSASALERERWKKSANKPQQFWLAKPRKQNLFPIPSPSTYFPTIPPSMIKGIARKK